MPPMILTGKELASTLNKTPGEVGTWANRGFVPSIKCGGRRYYDLARVIACLRRHTKADVERLTSATHGEDAVAS